MKGSSARHFAWLLVSFFFIDLSSYGAESAINEAKNGDTCGPCDVNISGAELEQLKEEAARGDLVAAKKVASYYVFNIAPEPQRLYWYSVAANLGDSVAQYNLGYWYLKEMSPTENLDNCEKGLYWISRAAQNNSSIAQNVDLGVWKLVLKCRWPQDDSND